jgi:hypothetical protein
VEQLEQSAASAAEYWPAPQLKQVAASNAPTSAE